MTISKINASGPAFAQKSPQGTTPKPHFVRGNSKSDGMSTIQGRRVSAAPDRLPKENPEFNREALKIILQSFASGQLQPYQVHRFDWQNPISGRKEMATMMAQPHQGLIMLHSPGLGTVQIGTNGDVMPLAGELVGPANHMVEQLAFEVIGRGI